jgi:hypothetical protein
MTVEFLGGFLGVRNSPDAFHADADCIFIVVPTMKRAMPESQGNDAYTVIAGSAACAGIFANDIPNKTTHTTATAQKFRILFFKWERSNLSLI